MRKTRAGAPTPAGGHILSADGSLPPAVAPSRVAGRISAAVVAIPARDEAEHIEACLRALAGQVNAAGAPWPADTFEVVVLANNCTDDTARVARTVGAHLGLALQVLEVEHPPERAHAGGARRAAMDAAADRLERMGAPGGAVLTTDADSRPRPDWLSLTLRALDEGADAVAGMVDLDAREAGEGARPPGGSGLHGPQAEYADLLAEISARLDPRPHDPWPNHIWAWGASLAVRADVYRAVGGLPPAPLAEDRAFADVLERGDLRLRRSREVRTWTSPRTRGRAPGGLADLLAASEARPGDLCDAALEPAARAFRRALARARARAVHGERPGFGATWAREEARAPRLARLRVTYGALPREIARARRLAAWLRRRDQAAR